MAVITHKDGTAAAILSSDQNRQLAEKVEQYKEDDAEKMAEIVEEFNGDLANIQEQIDASITSWFFAVDPTTSNPPASDWITPEQKAEHVGDLYLNKTNGKGFRWQYVSDHYEWVEVTDQNVLDVLYAASKAQDAVDSKRRTFVDTPVPPYDVGDLWVQGSQGDIKRCLTPKTAGQSYAATDWVLASKYTDDTRADQAYDLAEDASEANKYVTAISGKTGISVHMANDTSNYALVNSNGLYIYKGGSVKTAVLAGEMDFYAQYNGADSIPLKMTYNTSGYRKGSVISEEGNYKAYLELYVYSGNNAYVQLRAQKGTGTSDRSSIDIGPHSVSLDWHNVAAIQIGTGGSGSYPLITERGDVVADSFAISISSSNFTTTTGSISSVSMRRYGGVIQLTMTVTKSSATSAGSNVYAGTLKLSDYRPKALIECGSYSGSVGVIGSLDTDGSIIARVVGAELPSGRSPILTFTYLI